MKKIISGKLPSSRDKQKIDPPILKIKLKFTKLIKQSTKINR